MGCTGTAQRSKIVIPHNIGKMNVKYPTKAKLQIKQKDSTGRQTGVSQLVFDFSRPFLFSSESLSIPIPSLISRCVLPGLDPHKETEKKCQDFCLYIHNDKAILLALFDGHGKEGEKIVAMCATLVQSFFTENLQNYLENPSGFLEDICNFCDSSVKKSGNGVDSTSSGSTAVLVLLMNSSIFAASLGDSRALLASGSIPETYPVAKTVNYIASKHLYTHLSEVIPIQLTKDQKPEDPDEYARITKAGGFVKRISENGKQIGPHRVFDSSGKYPGLAMSRSIGDSSGSALGVISNPVCTRFGLKGDEKFVVLASDGVWDVMDNEDVATFVETYRKKCIPVDEPPIEVNTQNTIIAQLLCEEARMRWLKIIEEEDVLIDDISSVVLQFAGNS